MYCTGCGDKLTPIHLEEGYESHHACGENITQIIRSMLRQNRYGKPFNMTTLTIELKEE